MTIPPTRSAGDSGHIQDHNDIGTELASRLPLSGGTLTGTLSGTSASFSGTVSASDPTSDSHLATKSYVDAAGSGAFATATIRATFVAAAPGVPSIMDATSGQALTVTFPSGRFTQPPVVQCQALTMSTGSGNSSPYASFEPFSISTSSCSLFVSNKGPGTSIVGGGPITVGLVDVFAVQMTSGSSFG